MLQNAAKDALYSFFSFVNQRVFNDSYEVLRLAIPKYFIDVLALY